MSRRQNCQCLVLAWFTSVFCEIKVFPFDSTYLPVDAGQTTVSPQRTAKARMDSHQTRSRLTLGIRPRSPDSRLGSFLDNPLFFLFSILFPVRLGVSRFRGSTSSCDLFLFSSVETLTLSSGLCKLNRGDFSVQTASQEGRCRTMSVRRFRTARPFGHLADWTPRPLSPPPFLQREKDNALGLSTRSGQMIQLNES